MYPENGSQSQNKEQTSGSFLARRIRKIKDVILSVISGENNKEILSPMKAKDLVLNERKTLRQKTISCDEMMSIGDVIQTTFYDCNFIGETIKRVDFSGSVFNNCIFEFFNIDECKFIHSQFNNCEFKKLSNVNNSLFSHSIWNNPTFFQGVVDFLDCNLENISTHLPDMQDRVKSIIPHSSYIIDSMTSKHTTWCSDFEGSDGCWFDGVKKRVVAVRLKFSSLHLEIPTLILISRDGSQKGNYKLAFLVEHEMQFPSFSLYPGILYSMPNTQSSNLLREAFISTASDDKLLSEDNPYMYIRYGGIIDMPESNADKQIFRPYRPASTGNKDFAECISHGFNLAHPLLE